MTTDMTRHHDPRVAALYQRLEAARRVLPFATLMGRPEKKVVPKVVAKVASKPATPPRPRAKPMSESSSFAHLLQGDYRVPDYAEPTPRSIPTIDRDSGGIQGANGIIRPLTGQAAKLHAAAEKTRRPIDADTPQLPDDPIARRIIQAGIERRKPF